MTTALQKFDIGMVFPTQEALVALLGQTIATWVGAHLDESPTNGSTNLVKSDGIYDAIQALAADLTTLNNGIDSRIADIIAAELASGQSIATAITNAIYAEDLDSIRNTLAQQGLDIDGFVTGLASQVDAAVALKLANHPTLTALQASLHAIEELDLIKELLSHTDDGEIILDGVVLRDVKSNPDQHKVLDLTGEDALNKQYYCITPDGSSMTVVLPDADESGEGVRPGDDVYIEFRSTGNGSAPIAGILTESQYNAGQGETASTSILIGVLTSDDGESLAADAMYTRIRATYCYGRWMAEVVQFKDTVQASADLYDVVYNDNYSGLSWGYTDADILKGSYQLAGKQADYCGMKHAGWNTAANGTGTAYALGQTIILDDTNTTDAGANTNRKLTLYAQYTPHTNTQSVASSFSQETIDAHYRFGGTYSNANLYNAAAFATAVAGWQEATIKVQISFWWRTYGTRNASVDWVGAKIGDDEHKLDNRPGWTAFTKEENAFTIQLRRNSSSESFTLPTIQTAATEGCIIPYISAIVFE